MELTRREFVKESMATLGFLALPGGLFAPLLGHPLRGQPSAGLSGNLDYQEIDDWR